MKESGIKFTFTIAIPVKTYRLLGPIKEYLMKQGKATFSNGTVSRQDAVAFAITKCAEVLKISVDDSESELSLTDNPAQAIFLKEWKKKNGID